MKLLYTLLFAFFIGCDYAPTEHSHEHNHDDGVCWDDSANIVDGVVMEGVLYTCYTNYSEIDCSGHAFWISDMTCEEYCSSKECDLEEAVDSDETVEETVSCECTIIE